jgi:hypothetical protein
MMWLIVGKLYTEAEYDDLRCSRVEKLIMDFEGTFDVYYDSRFVLKGLPRLISENDDPEFWNTPFECDGGYWMSQDESDRRMKAMWAVSDEVRDKQCHLGVTVIKRPQKLPETHMIQPSEPWERR